MTLEETIIQSLGNLTPGLMAYFMFKQNQLLLSQKDKHQEEMLLIVKEVILKSNHTQN